MKKSNKKFSFKVIIDILKKLLENLIKSIKNFKFKNLLNDIKKGKIKGIILTILFLVIIIYLLLRLLLPSTILVKQGLLNLTTTANTSEISVKTNNNKNIKDLVSYVLVKGNVKSKYQIDKNKPEINMVGETEIKINNNTILKENVELIDANLYTQTISGTENKVSYEKDEKTVFLAKLANSDLKKIDKKLSGTSKANYKKVTDAFDKLISENSKSSLDWNVLNKNVTIEVKENTFVDLKLQLFEASKDPKFVEALTEVLNERIKDNNKVINQELVRLELQRFDATKFEEGSKIVFNINWITNKLNKIEVISKNNIKTIYKLYNSNVKKVDIKNKPNEVTGKTVRNSIFDETFSKESNKKLLEEVANNKGLSEELRAEANSYLKILEVQEQLKNNVNVYTQQSNTSSEIKIEELPNQTITQEEANKLIEENKNI